MSGKTRNRGTVKWGVIQVEDAINTLLLLDKFKCGASEIAVFKHSIFKLVGLNSHYLIMMYQKSYLSQDDVNESSVNNPKSQVN